jgi:uncharacterized membrane protein YfcA
MEVLIGFLIALGIGLTGVGAGSVTAPVLILFLHLPPAEAVGTALIFSAVAKTFAVPVYLTRRQVDLKILSYLLAGGIPGVVCGSILLSRFTAGRSNGVILTIVGAVVVLSAASSLIGFFLRRDVVRHQNRCPLLTFVAALIGLEVGFSSAGAGALGTVALLQLTTLPAAEVIGTDLMFGFVLSLLGGGFHFSQGSFNSVLALKLIGGGILGATLGAYLTKLFPKRALRMGLSVWLVWVGSQLCYRGLAVLSH